MSRKVSEITVCREKPTVTEVAGYYVVVFQRDVELTMALTEENRAICGILSARWQDAETGPPRNGKADGSPGTEADKTQVAEPDRPQDTDDDKPETPRKRPIDAPKWKILNRASRTIEYYGKPVRFAKTRFGIFEALILAEGRAVSYPEISQAGWGEETDRDVIEATVYQLNINLREEGIEEFVSCRHGRLFLVKKPQKPS